MNNDPLQDPYRPNPRPYRKKAGPDNAAAGFLIGLLFPLLGVLLLYFFWTGQASFASYLKMFVAFDSPVLLSNASKVISLSMIANLLPFYFFLNRKQYLTVRGILMSMVLIGVLIVLYRFVWQ